MLEAIKAIYNSLENIYGTWGTVLFIALCGGFVGFCIGYIIDYIRKPYNK